MRWLALNLEAPLVGFGGITVDNLGRSRDHPAISAITGLIGNAIGLERTETGRLEEIQSRLILASARKVGVGERVTDFQTSRLAIKDRGWTRMGFEGRTGEPCTYDSPHLAWRDYDADAKNVCVLSLRGDGFLDLDGLAHALDFPERPLFIGRKSCLPSGRINDGLIEAADALEALRQCLTAGTWRISLPDGHGNCFGARFTDIADTRNWMVGVHAGTRRVLEATIEIRGQA